MAIKEFIVLSESVKFFSINRTVLRGQRIDREHPCFDLILAYPAGYQHKITALNQFEAVMYDVKPKEVAKVEEVEVVPSQKEVEDSWVEPGRFEPDNAKKKAAKKK